MAKTPVPKMPAPPPGYEAGEPSIEVTTTQHFYPKRPKPKVGGLVKASKPAPMDVKIVDVSPKARKKVADWSKGYRKVE